MTKTDKKEQLYRREYSSTKYQSEKRKIPFNLTFEEWYFVVSGPCHYCGEYNSKIRHNKGKTAVIACNGIDRVNNDDPYDISNTVSCCSVCNYMKNTMDYEDFIYRVERIYNNFNKNG